MNSFSRGASMYVCICNAVTDREIAAAVSEGVHSMSELEERLLVGTCCGKCRDKASECLDRFRPPRPALTLAMSA